MKKIALMVDSSYGLLETEAREQGFFFVPIVIIWNGEERLSGVNITKEFMYDNLTSSVDFKTAACKMIDIENEYKKALKEHEHVIYIPLSKHLSSTIETAKLVASQEEFKGKVTVYDSEFIGPWILQLNELLVDMYKKDAPLEDYLKLFDYQRGKMKGWLFPNNLKRLYSGGRLSKTQYIAGSMLKIKPVMCVENGKIDEHNIVKARNFNNAIKYVVEQVKTMNDELINSGVEKTKVISLTVGYPDEISKALDKALEEVGFPKVINLWLPSAIIGHIGVGGTGAGVAEDLGNTYSKKLMNKLDKK